MSRFVYQASLLASFVLMLAFSPKANADFVTIGSIRGNVATDFQLLQAGTSIANLESLVSSSFASGNSGVVSFESPGFLNSPLDGIVDASFDGGSKVLRFAGTYDTNNQFAQSTPNRSGSNWLTVLNNVQVDLSLSGVNVAASELVTHLGFRVETFAAASGTSSGSAHVEFTDNTRSQSLNFNYRSNAASDYFLGFAAKENVGIETLFLNFDAGGVGGFQGGFIDDLSFVTATAVPEPSTALTFAAFGLVATSFRRRRLRTS